MAIIVSARVSFVVGFCLRKDPLVFWEVKGLCFGVDYVEIIKQLRKPNCPLTEIEGIFNAEKGKERLN